MVVIVVAVTPVGVVGVGGKIVLEPAKFTVLAEEVKTTFSVWLPTFVVNALTLTVAVLPELIISCAESDTKLVEFATLTVIVWLPVFVIKTDCEPPAVSCTWLP